MRGGKDEATTSVRVSKVLVKADRLEHNEVLLCVYLTGMHQGEGGAAQPGGILELIPEPDHSGYWVSKGSGLEVSFNNRQSGEAVVVLGSGVVHQNVKFQKLDRWSDAGDVPDHWVNRYDRVVDEAICADWAIVRNYWPDLNAAADSQKWVLGPGWGTTVVVALLGAAVSVLVGVDKSRKKRKVASDIALYGNFGAQFPYEFAVWFERHHWNCPFSAERLTKMDNFICWQGDPAMEFHDKKVQESLRVLVEAVCAFQAETVQYIFVISQSGDASTWAYGVPPEWKGQRQQKYLEAVNLCEEKARIVVGRYRDFVAVARDRLGV